MSDSLVGRQGLLSVMRKSSGAIHLYVPPGPWAEDSVQLRLAMDDRPKSVRQAQPELLIRMLALLKQKTIRALIGWVGTDVVRTYPLEVSMDYIVGMENLESVTNVE